MRRYRIDVNHPALGALSEEIDAEDAVEIGARLVSRLRGLERFDVLLRENALSIRITRVGPIDAEIAR